MDDLNFDDISGKKEKKETIVKKVVKENKKSGILLSIPVNKTEWLSKDIMETTGEEFAQWARGVYPVEITKPERFDDPRKRLQMFNKIAAFHRIAIFQEGPDRRRPTGEC